MAQNGLNAFYDSVELRRECCRIRKVEPLGRALAGNKAWVTGQRRAPRRTAAISHGTNGIPSSKMATIGADTADAGENATRRLFRC